MNTNKQSNKAARISRRDSLRRGVCGAAGVLAADRLGSRVVTAASQQPKPAAKVKAKSKGKINKRLYIELD